MTSVYKPSKIELYEAIGSALGDGKTRLEMRLAVKTENPSWRMPSQRKMTKYTKRVVKATSQGISPSAIPVDDASVSTRSSFSVRARNFVKGKGSSAAGGNGEASEEVVRLPSQGQQVVGRRAGLHQHPRHEGGGR